MYPKTAARGNHLHWRAAARHNRGMRRNWSVRVIQLSACVLLASACTQQPSAFPKQLDSALATGQLSAVLPLLTTASRPLLAALVQARGLAQCGLTMSGKASELQGEAAQGSRRVLQMQADGLSRDWVLVHEGGAWRLDLLETAVRRPWNAP